MFKKLLSLLFVVVFVCSAVPVFGEAEGPVLTELPIYFYNSVNQETLGVAFFDGCMDIPYCSVEAIVRLLNFMTDFKMESGRTTYRALEEARLLSLGEEEDPDCEVFYIKRENGSLVLFDDDVNMLWINNRDLFMVAPHALSGGDIVTADGLYHEEDGSIRWNNDDDRPFVNLYRRVPTHSFKREGESTSVFLSEYDISMVVYDDQLYLPLATVSDILMPAPITFNSEALFVTRDDLNNTVTNAEGLTQYDLFYRPAKRERSAELARFTYNELCLMLDHCYGLKEEHGVTNGFDQYFIAAGLEGDLKSTDPIVFTNALYQVLDGYFGDRHSGLTSASFYAGSDFQASGDNSSITWDDSKQLYDRFKKAREAAGITADDQIRDGYYEIGDTAFVTFDSFISAHKDYYDTSLYDHFHDIYMTDTISLVIWAHNRIHRQDSPIRKVVIDLSCNGGGHLNACMYIASWVLGAANLSIEDVSNGAQYTTVYWVDVDLDGKCLKDDELGVNYLDVYCLVNGNTFSSGNLLAALFKQDGRVTLVGQTTGGGACTVRNISAADGTLFSISSNYRMSIVKNGAFYNIDRGVEADIPLRKPASFYDRPALVEYLDTIR